MNHRLPTLDAAAIEAAAAHLATVRPAYASILGFYGPVYAAQLESAAETSPAEIDIDDSLLRMKSKAGFALIEPADFPIDMPAARRLLIKICRIAAASSEDIAHTAQALFEAMQSDRVADDCFAEALSENGGVPSLAGQLGVPADMLGLLFYLAVKPSVEKGARQLADRPAAHLEAPNDCPVCGRPPVIGELDHDGKQWLHCGLCWHRWPVARLTCPFCDNRDSGSLAYAFSESEPEYRVNLCDRCRRYVKVVEQVASLHLDMLAAEKGYRRIDD